MIKPNEVTLSNGYQICGTCGEIMLNGDKALVLDNVYAHPACAAQNPPDQWKVVRRVDAALVTRKTCSPEWYEVQLYSIPGEGAPREAQFKTRTDEEGNETDEPIAYTGQRWNGNVYTDCRDFLNKMAAKCDRPRVARLMERIAETQILRKERANLYASWEPERLKADRQ
jgi:hypothetical protein